MENKTLYATNQSKKRIGYIDALRGFTMILVVCVHCLTFSNIKQNPISDFFSLFRMPLFFFISGFILYKKEQIWDFSTTKNFISKKFLVQIIPTVIFLLIYMFCFNVNNIPAHYNGYWFTIALFEFFMAYCLVNFTFRKQSISNVILMIYAIITYLLQNAYWVGNYPNFNRFIAFPFGFFIFFLVGIWAKKYSDYILRIFNSDKIMMTVIAIMIVGAIFFIKGYFVHLEVKLLLSILGIFSIFYFFMKNGEYMDNSRIGKALQFIGRRTLDIYLLHYFFVFNSMSWANNAGINSPTIIFCISIVTSILIIGICLLVSKFLRTNELLGKILFGAKPSTNKN